MNLQNLDFTPLWITMKTGVAATFVSFFLGIFAARFVMGRKGKAVFWRTVLAFRQYIRGLAVCWRQRSSLFR